MYRRRNAASQRPKNCYNRVLASGEAGRTKLEAKAKQALEESSKRFLSTTVSSGTNASASENESDAEIDLNDASDSHENLFASESCTAISISTDDEKPQDGLPNIDIIPVKPDCSLQPRKRENQFKQEWITTFPWLQCKDGKSFCIICKKYISNKYSNIRRHARNEIHKNPEMRSAVGKPFRAIWKVKFTWLDLKDGNAFCTLCCKSVSNSLALIKAHGQGKYHQALEEKTKQTKSNEKVKNCISEKNFAKEENKCDDATNIVHNTISDYSDNNELHDATASDQMSRKKYDKQFQPIWKKQYPWIECKKGRSYCILCCKYLANNSMDLRNHIQSKTHQMIQNKLRNQPDYKSDISSLQEDDLKKLHQQNKLHTQVEANRYDVHSNDDKVKSTQKETFMKEVDTLKIKSPVTFVNEVEVEHKNDGSDDDLIDDINDGLIDDFDDDFNEDFYDDFDDALNDVELSDDSLSSFDESSNGCHTKPKRRFCVQWLKLFPWLECKKDRSFCKICQQYLANTVTNLKRHCNRMNHKAKDIMLNKCEKNDTKKTELNIESVKAAELKIMLFLCLYNLPFSLMLPLIELIKSIACESFDVINEINCSPEKVTQTMHNLLTDNSIDLLGESFRNKKISLIIDETPPISTAKSKNLVLIARYFDLEIGKICDRFLSIIEIFEKDSQAIFGAIKKVIEKFNIPFEHIVGLAADNSSTIMDRIYEIQTLFKNMNPNFYVLQDPLLIALDILNPISLGKSLLPLKRCFPGLVKNDDNNSLESEWKMMISSSIKEEQLEDFWYLVLNIEDAVGNLLYPHLKNFISDILCLTDSNATNETILTQIKYIIDTAREDLSVNTINSYMLAKECMNWEKLKEWAPSQDLILKYER